MFAADDISKQAHKESETRLHLKRKLQRNRTSFSQEQIGALEKEFERTHYPDVFSRERLSNKLSIPEARIQVWFSNRRAKWRREEKLRVEREKTGRTTVPAGGTVDGGSMAGPAPTSVMVSNLHSNAMFGLSQQMTDTYGFSSAMPNFGTPQTTSVHQTDPTLTGFHGYPCMLPVTNPSYMSAAVSSNQATLNAGFASTGLPMPNEYWHNRQI